MTTSVCFAKRSHLCFDAAAAAVQEMLLQSHTGTIVVFPAVPESWGDVAFTTLRAEGTFLVSAERRAGKTVEVEIISENGDACRLESPFTGAVVNLAFVAGETRVFREDP